MTIENSTELAITAQNITMQGAGAIATSIKADPTDREASAKLFNAMNNPGEKISNHINETISVQDYLIEMTEITSDETGEIVTVPRVVFVDTKGTTYQAVSVGMANVLKKLVMVCGDAPWKPALKLKIKQQATKRGSMLTADLVG